MTSRLFLVMLVVFCFGISASNAQSKRMVLIEEATNASCGPCASINPAWHAFLTSDEIRPHIVPLIWRAKFPGSDSMNLDNPTMHNGRVTYYSVAGVPHAYLNGQNGMHPAQMESFRTGIDLLKDKMSPITIAISETKSDDGTSVTVRVTSTEAIQGKKLRIVATEGYHLYPLKNGRSTAGNNGETEFHNIPRAMIGSEDGFDLDLVPNVPKEFSGTFMDKPGVWNADEMYVTAFVQDDETLEVLQAGSTQGTVAVTMTNPRFQLSGVAGNWSEKMTIPALGKYTLVIQTNMDPTWSSVVKLNGQAVISGSPVSLSTLQSNFDVTITPTTSLRRDGKVMVSITGPKGAYATATFRFYAENTSDVLYIARDEGRADISAQYATALNLGTSKYMMVDPVDDSQFPWSSAKVVLFETGKHVVSEADVAKLKSYFTAGGRMLLTGAEIAWGLADTGAQAQPYYHDIPFLENQLHAKYLSDGNGSDYAVSGMVGDPISDGISNLPINQAITNQDTPDNLAAIPNQSILIFNYRNNMAKGAGIRFADDKNRLVYLGFGLEGISSDAIRSQIISKSIAWLMGSQTTVGVNEETAGSRQPDLYPNPAQNLLSVTTKYLTPTAAEVALYDVAGVKIRSLANRQFEGEQTQRYDISGIANGVYTLVIRSESGAVSASSVTIVR